MTIRFIDYSGVFNEIVEQIDLNGDNIIQRIKKQFESRQIDYGEWQAANFHVDFLFQSILQGNKEDKHTLLHLAAHIGRIKIIKALIKQGADVNAVSQSHRNTPLHVAIGEIDVINALLDKGAKVDAVNKLGDTPLHIAVKDGNVNLVKALLDKGANSLLKNKDGKTPKDLAIDDSMKKLLEKAEEEPRRQRVITKGIVTGSSTALLGTAATVALFVTGTVAVELIPIVIAVAAIAAAALAVGGITYMMLKPSTEMDEVEEEQDITGDERKAWSAGFQCQLLS